MATRSPPVVAMLTLHSVPLLMLLLIGLVVMLTPPLHLPAPALPTLAPALPTLSPPLPLPPFQPVMGHVVTAEPVPAPTPAPLPALVDGRGLPRTLPLLPRLGGLPRPAPGVLPVRAGVAPVPPVLLPLPPVVALAPAPLPAFTLTLPPSLFTVSLVGSEKKGLSFDSFIRY